MEFRLNSPEGKQILATIRQGDYAHPGEEEAIAVVLDGLTPRPGQRVLDVGCGRGGTADWMLQQGWSEVVGIDRDGEAIDTAQQCYPRVHFHRCDVLSLQNARLGRFDLICLFNSFYAFAQQEQALQQLRAVAVPSAALRIFDYAQPVPGPLPVALGHEIGRPIALDRIETQLLQAGWRMHAVIDLSERYIRWYGSFLDKLACQQTALSASHGRDWVQFIADWYGALRQALVNGQLQGVLIQADPLSP